MMPDKINSFLYLTLKHVLFMLITFSLTWHPTLEASCSYPNDPELTQQQLSCDPNKTGAQRWDCNLNRCVNTADAIEKRNDYKKCLEKDVSAQKACFDEFAKGQAAKEGFKASDIDEKDGSDLGAMGVNSVFSALYVINLVAKTSKGSSCLSANVAGVTGIGGVLSYLYLNMFAKKKIDELRENYEDQKVIEGDAFNAQVRAFEYLKSEQEAVAEYAKKRKAAYTLLTVGYTAAFALAVYDAFKGGVCSNKKQEGEDSQENDQQVGDGAEGVNPPKEVTALLADKSKTFLKFMSSSTGVMIISGLGASYSGFLALQAGKQQEEAEENAKKIDGILAKFEDSVSGYCPNGRDSLSEPRCYCYLDNGAQNEDRSNSGTCQNLWAQDNKNFNVAASSYDRKSITQTKGCMLINREFDPDCKCRQLINSKGQNACFQSGFGAASFGSLGQSLGTPSFARNVDGLSSGSTTFGELNIGSLAQQARRNKEIGKQLLKKTNLKLKQEGRKPLPNLSRPLVENFTKQLLTKKALAKSKSLAGGIQSSRPKSGKLAEALKKAVKESGVGKVSFSKSKKMRRSKNNDDFNFKFNDSAKNARNLGGFTEKKYDFKENDIVKREDVSIWKVISHRYTQSGLRRLFKNEVPIESE